MSRVKVAPLVGTVMLTVEIGRSRSTIELDPDEAVKVSAWLLEAAVLAMQPPASSLIGLIGAIH